MCVVKIYIYVYIDVVKIYIYMYMHVYTHIYVCMGKPIKYTPIVFLALLFSSMKRKIK